MLPDGVDSTTWNEVAKLTVAKAEPQWNTPGAASTPWLLPFSWGPLAAGPLPGDSPSTQM
jgi:hypothetical protein